MKLPKIIETSETRYNEIREFEGHSTRGTGTYEEYEVTIYRVGKRKFRSLIEARRYLKSLKNQKRIRALKNQFKALMIKSKKLDSKLEALSDQIYKLGG